MSREDEFPNPATRDRAGRFRTGSASPNPKGRPKKVRSVDDAVQGALAEMVTVTEQGRRRRRSKLEVTTSQIANKGASGDLRAAKLALDQARKSEERAEAGAARAPVMTETDREIACRVIDRILKFHGIHARPDVDMAAVDDDVASLHQGGGRG
jgi:hypothetical protein